MLLSHTNTIFLLKECLKTKQKIKNFVHDTLHDTYTHWLTEEMKTNIDKAQSLTTTS